MYRAIPAAVATLAASFIAAGQFRAEWRKHRTAAHRLDYEILRYENELGEYRPDEPRPELQGVSLFVDKVYGISTSADDEPEERATKAPSGQAPTNPPTGQTPRNDNPPGAQ